MTGVKVWTLEKPRPWWAFWRRTEQRAVVILGIEPAWIEMKPGERRKL